jgi:hypothetical protein
MDGLVEVVEVVEWISWMDGVITSFVMFNQLPRPGQHAIHHILRQTIIPAVVTLLSLSLHPRHVRR